jgi:hypothetical protein
MRCFDCKRVIENEDDVVWIVGTAMCPRCVEKLETRREEALRLWLQTVKQRAKVPRSLVEGALRPILAALGWGGLLTILAALLCSGLIGVVLFFAQPGAAPPAEQRPAPDGPKQDRGPFPGKPEEEDAHKRKEREEKEEARKRKEREDAEVAERARQEEARRRAEAEAERKAAEAERKRHEAEAKKAAQDEEDAGERLKYAKKLLDRGMDEKAKERLQRIVKEWPDTKAAAEAKQLLAKMGP